MPTVSEIQVLDSVNTIVLQQTYSEFIIQEGIGPTPDLSNFVTLDQLGDSAFLPVGTTAGTVAAGDHTHAGVYQPFGNYLGLDSASSGEVNNFVITGYLDVQGGITGLTVSQLSDATATGKALVTAADATTARTAIGAASTASGLSQFPSGSTTSAQLAALLTDETGSGGGFVRASSPTIDAPIFTGGAEFRSTTGITRTAGGTDGILRLIHQSNPNEYSTILHSSGGLFLSNLIGGNGVYILPGIGMAVSASNGQSRVWLTPGGEARVVSGGAFTWSSGNADASPFGPDTGLSRTSAAVVKVTNGSTGYGALRAIFQPADYTVATLPSAAANTGKTVQVNDSSVAYSNSTVGNVVAGGGSNVLDVRSNGSEWRIC